MRSSAPALRTTAVVVLLVSSLLAAGAVGGAVAGEHPEDCSAVTHDAFRYTNSTIEEANKTGSATATVRNIPVTVEETDQFVRVRAENPNGYCVEVAIQISEEVVQPADLGTVDAVEPESSELEAEWRAKHSLEESEQYTEIAVQLPAGSPSVLFAPSKLRVETLAWTGEAKGEAQGTFGKVRELAGMRPDLQERSYQLEGEKGQVITVDLTADDGRSVEEWHGTYEDTNGVMRPVGQESDAPVFYSEDSDSVRMHYNKNRTVEFTANPKMRDKASYELASYRASLEDLINIELPLHTGGALP